jgi:hypothetical protein
VAGQRQLSADVEEFILNPAEAVQYRCGKSCTAQNETYRTICLVDSAARFDSSVGLWHTFAVGETGQAGVAASGIDFCQSIRHP